MKKILCGLSMFLMLSTTAYSAWNQYPGEAKDIGVGANGSVWVIGTGRVSGGYTIHEWGGDKWYRVLGGAVRIDVDPSGVPWVVNSSGKIYKWGGREWNQMPGAANDIGIGADGSVWVIGTDSVSGGYGIYKWNGGGWDQVRGGAVRIDVDNQGVPWVVNSVGNIYKWTGSQWSQMPGAAKDIGVGGGNIWVTGTDTTSGGYGIHKWMPAEGAWLTVPGGATQISVDNQGIPWVVNSSGKIYKNDSR